MAKLKVAILEDNAHLLKELKTNLEDTGLVEVIAYARDSEDFLDKIKKGRPDALIMDIDLGGDSMNGLDITNLLKLPTLFVSGKTGEYFKDIEAIDGNEKVPIKHITKPITLDKLNKILPKFLNEINSIQKKSISLDFFEKGTYNITEENIVYLSSKHEDSGNKEVYFIDRGPEVLIDFSFKKMLAKGFTEGLFVPIHKQYLVNKNKILSYSNNQIEIQVMKSGGLVSIIKLDVSENYRPSIRLLIKSNRS